MAGSSAVALAARRLARRLCLGPQHTASDVTPRLNPARRDPRVLAPATHGGADNLYLYVSTYPGGRETESGVRALVGAGCLGEKTCVGFVVLYSSDYRYVLISDKYR